MKELLIAQLDYIYFFYGLAFLISASIIFSLLKQEKSAIGLHLLGMFALLFGLVQWLNVVSILIYDGKALSIIRGAVTILSFLFLFEFGRGGLHLYKVRVPEKWIYFFPIAIILCGQFAGGIDGLLSASYYILGIPGALAAAAVFRFRYKEASRNKPYYLIFSVFFVLFGIVFSASVPKAAVFPCSIINEQSFLNYFHIPIQLLCGVLAFAFTVTFIFWVNELLEYGKKFKLSLQTATLYLPLTAVTVLVGCGWIVTKKYAGIG